MSKFETMKLEEEGIRVARGFLSEVRQKTFDEVKREISNVMVYTYNQLKKGGRSPKALSRIHSRVMKKFPEIQRLKINTSRSNLKVDLETLRSTITHRMVDGKNVYEPGMCTDYISIKWGMNTRGIVQHTCATVSQHAIARIWARYSHPKGETINESVINVINHMIGMIYTINGSQLDKFPWASIPWPMLDGMGIVYISGSESGIYFDLRTYVGRHQLTLEQEEMLEHISEEGLDALFHYPEHTKAIGGLK